MLLQQRPYEAGQLPGDRYGYFARFHASVGEMAAAASQTHSGVIGDVDSPLRLAKPASFESFAYAVLMAIMPGGFDQQGSDAFVA